MATTNEKKTILITGASSGFGEATARKFNQANYHVILASRDLEKLNNVKAQLGHSKLHVIELDVTKESDINSLLTRLPEAFQNIDILVNNAGLALGMEPAWDTDIAQWDTMLDTNCRGLMRMTRAILPHMINSNSGHIINISSTAANWPYPGGSTYGASKAFVSQFSRNLKADLNGKNIRVTNIEPGMSETNFSKVRFNGDKEKANEVYKGTQPLRADDIAEMIFWAASMPRHVNINNIEAMPTCQAWNAWNISRET